MGKKAYIGVNNVARKIKKGYVGVDGKARKVKKSYIGVGGVARPCFASGEVVAYGAITPLSTIKYDGVGFENGAYAIIACGFGTDGYTKTAEAYNSSLTKVSAPSANTTRYAPSATRIGNYGVIAGGSNTKSGDSYCVYDQSLTMQTVVGSKRYYDQAAAAVGNYGIFAGGRAAAMRTVYSSVEALSNNLIVSAVSALDVARHGSMAASIGNYAIIAGGALSTGSYNTVDCYSSSLVKTSISQLQTSRFYGGGANNSSYAIFAGGWSGASVTDIVEAYNSSLVKTTAPNLSAARKNIGSISFEDFTIFAGGAPYGASVGDIATYYANVDVYDTSLVRTSSSDLSVARAQPMGAVINNYGLFAGGWSRYHTNAVDAYVVA